VLCFEEERGTTVEEKSGGCAFAKLKRKKSLRESGASRRERGLLIRKGSPGLSEKEKRRELFLHI